MRAVVPNFKKSFELGFLNRSDHSILPRWRVGRPHSLVRRSWWRRCTVDGDVSFKLIEIENSASDSPVIVGRNVHRLVLIVRCQLATRRLGCSEKVNVTTEVKFV